MNPKGKKMPDKASPLGEHPQDVVRIAHTILQQAIKEHASEIQVDPGKQDIQVRFVIDGSLREIMKLPLNVQQGLTDLYKEMADMDLTQHDVPQAGHIALTSPDENGAPKDYDVHVRCLPNPFGESFVMSMTAR
jgi:type IV pilus assembly protein PilB